MMVTRSRLVVVAATLVALSLSLSACNQTAAPTTAKSTAASKGTFGSPTSYGSGAYPGAIAVADLNGDGHPDIVTSDWYTSGNVTVFINTGKGTYVSHLYPTNSSNRAASVAVGDVNGDGHPDIVVGIPTPGGGGIVSVLLNNGDGTFPTSAGSVPTYAVGEVDSLALADVNGDGHPDVVGVSANTYKLIVSLNDGSGGFATGAPGLASYGAGGVCPFPMAVADVNGDGHPDVVAGNACGGSVSVWLNDGSGAFPSSPLAVPSGLGVPVAALAVGDVTGDGRPDIVVGSAPNSGAGQVAVLKNKGGGSFAPLGGPYATGGTTWVGAVTVADVNGDGHADIVSANYTDHSVSVFLNQGHGTFPAKGVTYDTGTGTAPAAIAVARVNNDGKPDIVVSDSGTFFMHIRVAVLAAVGPSRVAVLLGK